MSNTLSVPTTDFYDALAVALEARMETAEAQGGMATAADCAAAMAWLDALDVGAPPFMVTIPERGVLRATISMALDALAAEGLKPDVREVVAVVVCCGWPNADGSYWLDVDGEGGIWSPGFVAVFDGGDFTVESMRSEILRRLNAKYGEGWPEGGVPPLTFTAEHFDASPGYGEYIPFIQAQWEPVALEAAPPPFWTVGAEHDGVTNWGEGVRVTVAHVSDCGRAAVMSETGRAVGRHWLAWREPGDDPGVWGFMDADDHISVTDRAAFRTLADAIAALPHYTPEL